MAAAVYPREIGPERVELVLNLGCLLGEGSLWHPTLRRLLHVDIDGHKVMLFDPATGENRVLPTPSRVGTVVPRARPDGDTTSDVVVCLEDGFHALSLATGELSRLAADPEPDKPENRFNDGKCDSRGRLWAGTMHTHPPRDPVGSLYRLDSGRVKQVLDGVRISNGLAWTRDDSTMYYIDTGAGQMVFAFDYDIETGTASNRREAFRYPVDFGHPDGCTLDSNGNLWTAHFAGGQVSCTDPTTGETLTTVRLPGGVTNVTSVAFGGDDLSDLYITTAREGLSPEDIEVRQPTAGGLFCVRGVGAVGLPANFYRG